MRASFVSALFNNLPLTQAMLASLRATLPAGLAHEIILVDNLSTDGTRAWLASLPSDPGLRLELAPANLGFAAANNHGARLARGEFLFLVNNDLEFLPGWFEPMLSALERHAADAGCIGNLQRRVVDGALDHRGVRLDLLRRPVHDHRRLSRRDRRAETLPYPAVTAACCAIRRDVFLAAGGFDEAFRNGYEDIDLCLRLTRDHGRRHYVAVRSVVRHHVSAAPGRFTRETDNLRLFLSRWGWPAPGPSPRIRALHYLGRHWSRPWRYRAGRLVLSLARLATGRPCAPLHSLLRLTPDL